MSDAMVDDTLGFDDAALDNYFNEATTDGAFDTTADPPLITQTQPQMQQKLEHQQNQFPEFDSNTNHQNSNSNNNNTMNNYSAEPVMSQQPEQLMDNIGDDDDDDEYDNEPQQQQQQQQLIASPTTSAAPRNITTSQYATTPLANIEPSQYQMSDTTAVDGQGMWVSWTRVFDQPRYACLDLLDNCLDATLQPNFDGRVIMKKLEPNGMIILNNSAKPIKSLKDVLVVYASSKRDGKEQKRTDAIGENGVGLKHGCATLSNTNFVLTRNFNTYSFGLIARSLQTKQGVNLPSFEFTIEDDEAKSPQEIEAELRGHIETIVHLNDSIADCVRKHLSPNDNLEFGITVLVERCQEMWNDFWEPFDHVFQVLIAEMIHSHDQSGQDQDNVAVNSRRSHGGNNPASLFLAEIKHLLPKFYVNIPAHGFEFFIEGEKVIFSYWQHRLVEMTKFKVFVPKNMPIQDDDTYNWYQHGYPLSIYCGFEALRVEDTERGDACQMYIYSRASGRLIKHDDDARVTLSLPASGVDYCQGLTVIVDDVGAELPLMPTKQGIAWTEQRGGEAHRANLMAWAGACAKCFWSYHAKLIQRKCNTNAYKTIMRENLVSFADVVRNHLHQQQTAPTPALMERLENAHFSDFGDLQWKKELSRQNRKLKITKAITKDMCPDPGRATIFKFTDEHYPAPKAAPQVQPRQRKRQLSESPPMQQPSVANPLPTPMQQLQQQPPMQQRPPWQQFQQHPPPWQQLSHHQRQQWQQQQQQQNRQKQQWQHNKHPPTQQQLSQQQQQQDVIVLDDDDSDGNYASRPAQRQVARKSTGGSTPASSDQDQQLRKAFAACQADLREQKRLMAETQIEHQDAIRRLQEEVKYAQAEAKMSGRNGNNGSGDNPEALREAQDELIIVKRQKKQLDKELRGEREKHGTEVGALKRDIERLKLKTREQARVIKNGEGENGSTSANATTQSSDTKKDSWLSRIAKVKCEFEGTDEL